MRMKWRLLNVTALLAVSAGCSAREASPEQLLMRCEQGVGEGYLEARRALLARRDARKLLASGKVS